VVVVVCAATFNRYRLSIGLDASGILDLKDAVLMDPIPEAAPKSPKGDKAAAPEGKISCDPALGLGRGE
jgi:hypothetical protein